MKPHKKTPFGPGTVCIHGGYRATAAAPGVVAPTDRSTTFLQGGDETHGDPFGAPWVYSRYANPTVAVVEERLAQLEGGEQALAFASGMGALHAALMTLARPGETVLVSDRMYGGSLELLHNGLAPLGIRAEEYALAGDGLARALDRVAGASVVWVESISNPLLAVADLDAIVATAHAAGARVLVDATFASPVLQRPLEHGADLVMHSCTKYLGGHGDVTAGALVGSRELMLAALAWRKRAGAVLDPGAASLLERGIKTLAVRMRAHVENATRLARELSGHPQVRTVHYPGLESSPSHALAQRLLEAPGGMLSFEIEGGDAAAKRCVQGLELALNAPSLGSVETLVSLPCEMSHAHLSPDARLRAGIEPGLIRVSVGIEDVDDLCADFTQAIERAVAANA